VNLGLKLKTEQLQIVEMFWQVFSLDICLDKWKQTTGTVAIPDQFEILIDKLCQCIFFTPKVTLYELQ
jgi:hypothetical protein